MLNETRSQVTLGAGLYPVSAAGFGRTGASDKLLQNWTVSYYTCLFFCWEPETTKNSKIWD